MKFARRPRYHRRGLDRVEGSESQYATLEWKEMWCRQVTAATHGFAPPGVDEPKGMVHRRCFFHKPPGRRTAGVNAQVAEVVASCTACRAGEHRPGLQPESNLRTQLVRSLAPAEPSGPLTPHRTIRRASRALHHKGALSKQVITTVGTSPPLSQLRKSPKLLWSSYLKNWMAEVTAPTSTGVRNLTLSFTLFHGCLRGMGNEATTPGGPTKICADPEQMK